MDRNKIEKEALEWLDSQLTMVGMYKKGGQSVFFAQNRAFDKNWTEVMPGLEGRLVEDKGDVIILKSKIKAGVKVKIHKHPDFIEEITVEKGICFDKVGDTLMKARMTYIFDKEQWHELICLEDAVLITKCIRK